MKIIIGNINFKFCNEVLSIFLVAMLLGSCGNDSTGEANENLERVTRMGCSYTGNISAATELCEFYGGKSLSSNEEAEDALQKIMAVTGISSRFVLSQCNDISNCLATSYNGIRYIVYDKDFMSDISNRTNSWSNISILAHEIGHHVNGHSLDLVLYSTGSVSPPTLKESKEMELEADEFSGFVLSKLGATLKEAQQAISLISDNSDDTHSTHPSKDKRLAAIERGYKLAKRKPDEFVYQEKSSELTAEDYFYKGYNEKSDNEYKVNCFSKCLSLDPDYGGSVIYQFRADAYYNLGQYQKAIDDYNRVIKLGGDDSATYNNRAAAYSKLGMYQLAIDDCNRALKISPDEPNTYNTRGTIYSDMGRHQLAIDDFSTALKLDPDNHMAYYNRGLDYENLGQYQKAIDDYTRSININPNYYVAYNNRGILFKELGQYQKAIDDYNQALRIKPNDSFALSNRGIAKFYLGLDCCNDLKRACEIDGGGASCRNYHKVCN